MNNQRLPRLIRMILLLQAHPGLSADEFAERSRVSVRTCYRDLKTLQDAGVPLYNDHGWRLVSNTALKTVQFTLEEATSLIYGLKLIDRQKGLGYSSQSLKEKLLAILPEALSARIEKMDPRIDLAMETGVDYSQKMELFKKINDAISERKSLKIIYYTLSRDQISERQVDPYQLAFKDGFWYLAAYCHLRQAIRLFRVDRIRKMEITNEQFAIPDHFNFETYMGSAWQMERGEEFTFLVRFSGESVRFVRETSFHPSQTVKDALDGTLYYQAKACSVRSVARWVLTFGADAEVLEPMELRAYVSGQIQKMYKMYGKE